MKISKWVFVALACLAVSALGWSKIRASAFGKSQDQSTAVRPSHSARGIPGYLDPETGLFTAEAQTVAPTPAVTTPVTFRLVVPFNIQFTDQPSNSTLACNVFIQGSEGQEESAVGLSSDGGKTCQATILATWNLANPATDAISIGYELMASPIGSDGQVVQFPTYDFGFPASVRDGNCFNGQCIPKIAMPANGQTITLGTITVSM